MSTMTDWKQTDCLIDQEEQLVHSSQALQILPPSVYLAIVYKHPGNVRRTVFFDQDSILLSREPLSDLTRMLPGLVQSLGSILNLFSTAEPHNLYADSIFLTSPSRGSQSFAYGHFIIDILPYLFYASLISRFKSYAPLLYQREEWQQNLLATCFDNSPRLAYFSDLSPFFSTPYLDAYKIMSQVVHLPRRNHALYVFQKVLASKLVQTNARDSDHEIGVLFLVRANIAGRSDRWSNADSCLDALQKSIRLPVFRVNPSEYLPSDIAKFVSMTSVTLTAAGSAAYNSLLFGDANHITILVVPYSVSSDLTWQFTLRMFIPFSNRLILISNLYAPKPCAEGWDSTTSLDPYDLSNAIASILKYSFKASSTYPDVFRRRTHAVSSLIVNYPA
jgi:hypothetical protein